MTGNFDSAIAPYVCDTKSVGQIPYRPLFRRPLFRHIWPMWRDLGPAEERAGGKRAGRRKVRVQKSIPSQYATLFSRVSHIFDQLKCFSDRYEPFPTIKHFRKHNIVKIDNLATRRGGGGNMGIFGDSIKNTEIPIPINGDPHKSINDTVKCGGN